MGTGSDGIYSMFGGRAPFRQQPVVITDRGGYPSFRQRMISTQWQPLTLSEWQQQDQDWADYAPLPAKLRTDSSLQRAPSPMDAWSCPDKLPDFLIAKEQHGMHFPVGTMLHRFYLRRAAPHELCGALRFLPCCTGQLLSHTLHTSLPRTVLCDTLFVCDR